MRDASSHILRKRWTDFPIYELCVTDEAIWLQQISSWNVNASLAYPSVQLLDEIYNNNTHPQM